MQYRNVKIFGDNFLNEFLNCIRYFNLNNPGHLYNFVYVNRFFYNLFLHDSFYWNFNDLFILNLFFDFHYLRYIIWYILINWSWNFNDFFLYDFIVYRYLIVHSSFNNFVNRNLLINDNLILNDLGSMWSNY